MKFDKQRELDFHATIRMREQDIENVLCRAYLPLKSTDSIELCFYPTEEQLVTLTGLFYFQYSVKGEEKSSGDEVLALIEAEVVYSNNLTSYPYNRIEPHLIGEPADLKIIQLLNHSGDEQKVQGNFWLTSSPLLQPAFISEYSFTGDTKITEVRNFDFSLDNGVKLMFRNYHKRYENKDRDGVSFFELVARFEIEGQTNEDDIIGETLKKLDDVLLLTSFAQRRKSICVGWDSYDYKTLVKKYIKNRTLPEDSGRKVSRRESLVELSDFPEFMETVFPNFQNYHDIDAFRGTLNFITPTYENNLTSSFISLYSALEMIVLHFRRKNDLEFILPIKRFEKVRNEFKKIIKASSLIEEDDLKNEMKKKLSELNRISFASAFNKFCEFYSIDLSDLWQVNSNSDGISLSQVRNKLVHGEHFSSAQFLTLFYAREHLRWTLERMILGILGWSVERSSVSNSYLKMMTPYQDWQEKLSNFN